MYNTLIISTMKIFYLEKTENISESKEIGMVVGYTITEF